jgi:hypothetical protein
VVPTAGVELVIVAAVLVAVAALWASARRAVTVCVLEIAGGQVRVVRGGLAPRLLSDIEDVVARPRIERATLRIVRDSGRARLQVTGPVSIVQQQRLRNVVGSVPLAMLANATRK